MITISRAVQPRSHMIRGVRRHKGRQVSIIPHLKTSRHRHPSRQICHRRIAPNLPLCEQLVLHCEPLRCRQSAIEYGDFIHCSANTSTKILSSQNTEPRIRCAAAKIKITSCKESCITAIKPINKYCSV